LWLSIVIPPVASIPFEGTDRPEYTYRNIKYMVHG